jgi:anti-sigma factor RsiW
MANEIVSDETLGAYLDGELDAAAVASVDRRLALDAALRARLASLRDVTELVRAATAAPGVPRAAPAALEDGAFTFPPRGSAQPAAAPHPARDTPRLRPRFLPSRPLARGIAASFAAAVAGALLAVLLLARSPSAEGWQQHALVFHASYLAALDAKRTPLLDARASDPAALGASLAALADDALAVVPDLSEHGYVPQGVRVIETAEGPVAYVVYAGANKPVLGLAVLRSTNDDADGEVRLHQHGELKLLEWSDGEHRFAVGGTQSAASLRTLADAVQTFADADDSSI